MERVQELRGLVLPILSTDHLLFLLNNWSGLSFINEVMDELCARDLVAALRYLINLPYSHGNRAGMKRSITRQVQRTSVERLRETYSVFPRLSALVRDDNGVLVAEMGPLTDFQTGLWDSHDFYFHCIHAKKMAGTFGFHRYCMSLRLFCNARLSFA